jgi:hypothetical protein
MIVVKKLLKKIAILLILLIVIYSYLLSDYNPMFENEEFVYLTNKLKDSRNEDLKAFTDIYKIVYKHERRCPCEIATNHIGPYRHGYSPTKGIYQLKIKKEFSTDDCINFLFLNTDYNHGNIGIKKAANFYFNKTLNELNEKEKLTLIAIIKNSSLYDPIRNPKGVASRVNVFKAILKGHKK